ncbi:Oidioi.mRNA.OKI2018_I69.PAR.g11063.t1.cds [Oikopleura dioica]|uniref:Oidioi.mRNA.OKI2018_I69.PAR.g11063.t1.cds n=1 Tax=Oikopleura dioica TaxID=34765 RepID=A0ABN7S044_OIKDI|nr:Oidioi.mRNA.OKI2018_I69.PAR.g11063.t1.cds [Oikopleura dioica]
MEGWEVLMIVIAVIAFLVCFSYLLKCCWKLKKIRTSSSNGSESPVADAEARPSSNSADSDTRPEPIAPSQIEIDAPEVPEESVSRGKEDLPPSYDDILNEW